MVTMINSEKANLFVVEPPSLTGTNFVMAISAFASTGNVTEA